MTDKETNVATTAPDATQEAPIPTAIGAASLSPERRRLGMGFAIVGLVGFFASMIVTTTVPSMRVPGAVGVPVFFVLWKIGKTILRGNIDRI